MDFRDYYATLGVPKTASAADIKRAFRKLARQYHPDVNPGDKTAEAKFKEINEANEVLGDPESRKKYDELGANWRQYEQAQQQGGPFPGGGPFRGGAPPGWSGGTGATGGGGYRTMTPDEMRDMFGADDPFSDFFHTFFGGAGGRGFSGGRRPRGPVRGQDLESTIDLTLEEAFSGTTRRLMREGASKPIEVRIPAGVKAGARVRATGEGEPASGGGKAGDLYLNVRVLPHGQFERRDQDLYVHVSVPVTLAVLGGEMAVPTLTGATVRLKLPELTQAGQVFRLRGHGMPAVGKPDARGDLYATVDIKLPSQLSDAEREHYAALRELSATRAS